MIHIHLKLSCVLYKLTRLPAVTFTHGSSPFTFVCNSKAVMIPFKLYTCKHIYPVKWLEALPCD